MNCIHLSYNLLRFRQARLKAIEFSPDITDAGSGEIDFKPASEITKHLKNVLTRGDLGYAFPATS